MGKIWKYLILYSMLLILLSGCGNVHAAEPVQPDLVAKVEVSYQNKGVHLHRIYTSTEKIDNILFYLYSLSPGSYTETDPERIPEPSCKIIVSTGSGIRHIYRQRGRNYLSVDCKPWQLIDPQKSSRLFPLIARTCSD